MSELLTMSTETGKSNTFEPTEEQKRLLGVMLHQALLEIRLLTWSGQSKQAGDLADAFHNLPIYMFSPDFDWDFFQHFIVTYQNRYPRPHLGPFFDFVSIFDEIKRKTK